ncbi:MAG: dimethyladenosine transferase [Clostridiales bacterium 38-18]|nr:MAG: dimethyladenosine transferase [Clostridiales bacterium 38-18]
MKFKISIILFDQFELLDAFGPAEIFGKEEDIFVTKFYSKNGGIVESAQGVKILTERYVKELEYINVLLIPGGQGSRALVTDMDFIEYLDKISQISNYILTVCTGAALLAKTKHLDGREATTNKRAFEWVADQNKKVLWVRKARWVKSDNIYTSSGISAGMDMSLGFIRDVIDEALALKIGHRIEYIWNPDCNEDPFSVE